MTTERDKLIERLKCADVNYDPASAVESMHQAADMLAADSDLRTQLACRTVERDMAIKMAADGAQGKPKPVYLDGINCERLCESLTFMGVAGPSSMESLALSMSDHINHLTQAIMRLKCTMAKGGAA